MIERKCPSCGGGVPFRTSIGLLAVCPFCRSLVQRKDLLLEDLGKVAQLQADGTPLQVGARGKYLGSPFEAVGRVQLRMPVGFWNEWAIVFADGRQGWLGEAQGTYAVSFLVEAKVPAFADLKLGMKVKIGETSYRVRELVKARYVAAEGELPYKPPLGMSEAVPSADLIAPGGVFATLDYSETPPVVFAGSYQEFDALEFTGLRKIEGWP
ncbi:MAG: hypothetical protein A2V88_11030 [Elusimicrobia bacterium RBG_16_66_12]|nr:MAG: hypothetical protein A2V88_11030 [Elusimicrobia bacterium RBG_16_66_12]